MKEDGKSTLLERESTKSSLQSIGLYNDGRIPRVVKFGTTGMKVFARLERGVSLLIQFDGSLWMALLRCSGPPLRSIMLNIE